MEPTAKFHDLSRLATGGSGFCRDRSEQHHMPRKPKLPPEFERDWKKRADEARAAAEKLPPGTERDHLLRTARQLDTASHMSDWLTSPGLTPPNS